MTTVEATLARLAWELDESAFLDVFAEADRLGLVNDQRLIAQLDRLKGRSGVMTLRDVAADRDPAVRRARSKLEVLMLKLIRRAKIPGPEVNVRVDGYLADFVWRKERLIVETDGYRYHRGRERFERDAEIANRLRSLGWILLRYTYRMVTRKPETVAKEIREALAHGARML